MTYIDSDDKLRIDIICSQMKFLSHHGKLKCFSKLERGYPGYYWGVGKNKKKSPKKKETLNKEKEILPTQPYDSVILDLNKQIKEVNKKIQSEFKKTGVKLDDNHPLIVKQKELLTAKAARREEINKKTNDNERQEGKELDEWILVKNDI